MIERGNPGRGTRQATKPPAWRQPDTDTHLQRNDEGSYRFEVVQPHEAADDLLALAGARKLTVFAGAFVSARTPSRLPTAVELKNAFVVELWRPLRSRLAPHIGNGPWRLFRGSLWRELPLELVAESLLERTDLRADQLLSFIGASIANVNHAVLATMLDRGLSRVVTTNFDELVEAQREQPGDSRGLSKPHGTFSVPDEMAIRLSQVGRGIVSPSIRRRLADDLRGRDVCFVGYSGRDLDIRPILRAESIRSVLWIARPPLPGESAADVRATHEYVATLFKTTTPIHCVSVDADALLDELSRRLSLSPRISGRPVPWRRTLARELRGLPWQRQALALGGLLGLSGRWRYARNVFSLVEAALVPPSDKAYAALDHMAACFRLQEYAEAKAAGRRAVTRFRRLGDADGLARCYGLLGLIAERSSVRGQGWAIRYMKKSAELHDAGPPTPDLIGAQLNLGTWLKNRGRFTEADATQQEALRKARALGDIPHEMRIRLAIGIMRGFQRHRALADGDPAAASRLAASARYHLERARDTAVFLGETSNELRCVNALIALELDTSLRRFSAGKADRLIAQAERLASRTPEPDQRHYVATVRADWLNRVGRSRQAIAVLNHAVRNAQSKVFRSEALIERARARLALGKVDAAMADLVQAMALLPEGPRRVTVRKLLATAEAYRRSDGPLSQSGSV